MNLDELSRLNESVREQVGKLLIGYGEITELLLIALLSRSHVLLEGPPGTAKTLLAKAFSACLSLKFGRIQFTPDLMPGDVLGTNLFNFNTNSFELVKGPIFTELLLTDEINRTPPKTQAALLEAMNEQAVTIDGKTFELGRGFMVIATQNPIEQQGTYPLPEAQLDRFLFKLIMSYPERDIEREIVATHSLGHETPSVQSADIQPVADLTVIENARKLTAQVRISQEVNDYIVDLARATREDSALSHGVSPRAATMLAISARAKAALSGRDYVIPDDVKALLSPVFRHRVVLGSDALIDGLDADEVVLRLTETVQPPK